MKGRPMPQDAVEAGGHARPTPSQPERYDVVILGGGAAGLTLALQLKQARPDISMLVVERQQHPVPEAAHKVGESTVEIGGRYLRDVLGLTEHLREQQLDKFGIRMFFSAEGNEDITRRAEVGHAVLPPYDVSSFQLDRGRLENYLASDLVERGVRFVYGKVEDVDLRSDQPHRVTIVGTDGGRQQVETRWALDATGRYSLLKRKLGLTRDSEHRAEAVWFRIGHPIDINDWSDDPQWQGRIQSGRRELSTNHLLGRGYWVWLIRLASDSISIGIVADPDLHPFDTMNRFERALDWLREHEPQCARVVEEHKDKLQDFKVLRNYPYSVEQVYSADRWALTGEAGLFLDPFYSPGFDMISISNGLITDLVTRDLDGEDITELAAIHNQMYLTIGEGWFKIYTHQYPLMGNARVMQSKVIWDTAVYWAVPALLYFHDKIRRLVDHPQLVWGLARFHAAINHVQRFFREWDAVDRSQLKDSFASFYHFDFMKRVHIGLVAEMNDEEFEAQFEENVRLVERISGQLIKRILDEGDAEEGNEPMRAQVERWRGDDELMRFVEVYEKDRAAGILDDDWIPATKTAQN
ncbi:tryptophan 7-halogenase [Streptantibioticus rubrisoli]|uniref:Tryptophan 7-halogenase n=1 Tax=Streptantibioticus rubrisoli TaxID=1387313 RepID=A0ABT1P6L5_9ACTN|nr:tryptophan 7-halogenase [Streptantibioticus rubrisoli]MCQ4041017.1 tryptophan 7-halogenase [Streptantibioticus rubrisoli]